METRSNTDPLDLDETVGSAYAAHRAALLRHLTAYTRDRDGAEDLTQEAFLRLTAEVSAGRVPNDVGAWLHRVGRNLATSRGRRRSVADRRRGELLVRVDAGSPEDAVMEAEDQSSARAALEILGPLPRRALVLSAHGYRGREIAAAIGRSEGATRTLMCRARARIRAQFASAAWP